MRYLILKSVSQTGRSERIEWAVIFKMNGPKNNHKLERSICESEESKTRRIQN